MRCSDKILFMKTKLILFLGLLLVSFPNILSADEYTLNDLYLLALQRSETIKIAEENLYLSELGRDKAVAALLPTFSAFADHTRYSEEKGNGDFILQPKHTNSWGLRLDQSLSLSGKEITGVRISKSSIKKSSFDLKAVKEEYLFRVALSYYDLLKTKKNLEIAEVNVERLTKHRDAAGARFRVGGATKTVLLRAEAELAGAHADLIRAENALRFAKVLLGRKAGIRDEYDVKDDINKVEEIFYIEGCSSASLDCLKEIALKMRPEVKALSIQRDIAEDEVGYTKGGYWPTLSLEGVYLREEDEPASTFALTERIYGGVRIDFPFFEGGLRRAEVRESRARLRQSVLRLNDVKRTVEVEVDSAYLAVVTSSGVLDSLKAEVEFASDNYNVVTKQFQHGLADSIDVMDANTLLVTAEREFVTARLNFRLASLGLRRATGTFMKEVFSYGIPDDDNISGK